MTGLQKGEVYIVEHEDSWAQSFVCEKDILQNILGEWVVDILHIGSTAIPGLKAKPLVDILVGVRKLEDFQKFDFQKLKGQGYYHLAKVKIEGKEVIAKFASLEPLIKTHVVHIVEFEEEWWQKHLLFRDRLIAQPELAKEYEDLKVNLSKEFPENETAYANAKLGFVKRVLAMNME
ncbi:GrpB family protein [Viridibacillus sp. YIM B01967]|uniref:GrpB family protein n=1 Tax=Viridibacillus soli TaxID=2798301 RepID=A0ABS1HAF9_9BACL|nr:GrpB family protein [Viridibacillus soli]MBK3496417.1 GrpB family protein [Viridibacillus soli]